MLYEVITPVKNKEITVDEEAISKTGAILYYASINEENGKLIITGSRSAAVTGVSENIEEAEKIAQDAIVNFKGEIFFRRDIGTSKLIEKRIKRMDELTNK